jgi:hypothetical protein
MSDQAFTQFEDLIAVESRVQQVTQRMVEDKALLAQPELHQLMQAVQETSAKNLDEMERHLRMTGNGTSAPEKLVAQVGTLLGMGDTKHHVTTTPAALCDTYAMLSLAAAGYTALHTAGLVRQDTHMAEIALRNLRQITPLIAEISKVIPQAVTQALAAEVGEIEPEVHVEAFRNTQAAWSSEQIDLATTYYHGR